jgi:hypothetical protein
MTGTAADAIEQWMDAKQASRAKSCEPNDERRIAREFSGSGKGSSSQATGGLGGVG